MQMCLQADIVTGVQQFRKKTVFPEVVLQRLVFVVAQLDAALLSSPLLQWVPFKKRNQTTNVLGRIINKDILQARRLSQVWLYQGWSSGMKIEALTPTWKSHLATPVLSDLMIADAICATASGRHILKMLFTHTHTGFWIRQWPLKTKLQQTGGLHLSTQMLRSFPALGWLQVEVVPCPLRSRKHSEPLGKAQSVTRDDCSGNTKPLGITCLLTVLQPTSHFGLDSLNFNCNKANCRNAQPLEKGLQVQHLELQSCTAMILTRANSFTAGNAPSMHSLLCKHKALCLDTKRHELLAQAAARDTETQSHSLSFEFELVFCLSSGQTDTAALSWTQFSCLGFDSSIDKPQRKKQQVIYDLDVPGPAGGRDSPRLILEFSHLHRIQLKTKVFISVLEKQRAWKFTLVSLSHHLQSLEQICQGTSFGTDAEPMYQRRTAPVTHPPECGKNQITKHFLVLGQSSIMLWSSTDLQAGPQLGSQGHCTPPPLPFGELTDISHCFRRRASKKAAEVKEGHVESICGKEKTNMFVSLSQPTSVYCRNSTGISDTEEGWLCNEEGMKKEAALPAPSGTLGKGQLQVRRSSRVQEGWDEPGLSFLSVPGKAAVRLGKLQEDSFLSLGCCCDGHHLKTGGKGEERKKTLYIKHTEYLYSVQSQFIRIVFRTVTYHSVTALMREICGQKRSQGKEIKTDTSLKIFFCFSKLLVWKTNQKTRKAQKADLGTRDFGFFL
ncbi:hypothetical protein EK904_010677 [Melospiza melodia maxima]|nr:hypothetical protein EK904_010677 [Melospiza melodia maxima]